MNFDFSQSTYFKTIITLLSECAWEYITCNTADSIIILYYPPLHSGSWKVEWL